MQFYTLNSLINQFRYASQNHAQIKGFNFGRDAEIAASEQEKYPLLWIDVTDSNIEGTVMTVSILMKVIDIQQPDRENEIENLSDMLSIAQDVYAAMSAPAYQDYFIIQYASTLTPIREAYTDLVNGWEMRLDFSFMQDRNRCQIPTNDIPFPPVASCAKANITLNGETFIEVASGQTENIELVNQDNVEITPLSTVGSTIEIERYLFTIIDSMTTTPNDLYGVLVPYVEQPKALEITYSTLTNVPYEGADASSVSDWNTFFDLPTNGTPFTSVEVVSNTVKLYGGSGITIKTRLFCTDLYVDFPHLLTVIDNAMCLVASNESGFQQCINMTVCTLREDFIFNEISVFNDCDNLIAYNGNTTNIPSGTFEFSRYFTTFNNVSATNIGSRCFAGCFENFTTANLPNATTIGTQAFAVCSALTTINIPSCISLGTSVTDASVFNSIMGNTITLTVPSALMTANAGAPHASIAKLQANNTVTVITV